ncbi:MAG TPA: PQQ-dependent dehydrogenase, methanol/ethanol family [Acidobacteria bacterium]|nr:PQQ-dependent dehydrogenase, methanol/ethanol family [Acidobacteriota bacterium]
MLLMVWTCFAQQAAVDYTPVTDERLRSPNPDDWLMYRGTYDSWGYSPLDQITTDNVSRLVPVWSLSTGVISGHQSPPIVNDGVMFVTTPEDQVLAVDARSGDLLWRHRRQLPDDALRAHWTNRGVGLYGDRVYFTTHDAFVVALDAGTGEVEWEASVADYRTGYYMTMAPLIANGKVLVGASGGERGIRGFVAAYDANSGEEVWRSHTVPGPGEPGNETWPGDTWRTGGASIWITGSFDPELNLTYWGTGNPGPWIGDQRPGDNLYTNSVVAFDADTGELKAYHQYHHNGSWDWDEVSAPLLIDVSRGGRTIKSLVHPARNGYLWLLEREADAINFVDANPYVDQNVFASIDPVTGRPEYNQERKPGTNKPATFCPSLWGGKDWPPAAYSPQTGYLYIPANENLCSTIVGREVEYRPGAGYTGATSQVFVADGADHLGELQAWDLSTGEQVWTHEFPESQNWGPILTTGGGLVFAGGTHDRYFRAFDARTGDVLWEQRTNSGVIGVPSSFAIDGVQYIAVQSGWGVDAQGMQRAVNQHLDRNIQVPQGGVIWVFALQP